MDDRHAAQMPGGGDDVAGHRAALTIFSNNGRCSFRSPAGSNGDAQLLSVPQLLAAKGTRPIRSLDELAADTFKSDEEVEEFLAFTYAERHGDLV